MRIEMEIVRTYAREVEALAALVTSFQGMTRWHPFVGSSTGQGEEVGARRVFTAGPDEVEEELTGRSARHVEYVIVRTPHPIRGYRARLEVAEHEGRAMVSWRCSFEVDEEALEYVREGFRAFYLAGLEGLEAAK